MLKTNEEKRGHRNGLNFTGAALCLAVQTDSNSRLAPTLRLEPRGSFSIANSTRGKHLEFNTFGPVAGAAAVTALQLAQIEIRAQIALQQLSSLATITVGNQCLNNNNNNDNNRFAAALPRQLALLSLLSRQQVSAIGFNRDTICKTFKATQPCLPAAMYHHHSQQQGPQPFSNGPRPHHQPHPNQHQNHTPSDMLTQAMGFQFPRPTQLPDELESALAIRGARDMDHRLIDHMNPPNQHQNQGSVTGINQHGTYSSSMLTSDNQGGHQQGVDWSNYQPPTKLFGSPSPSSSHQSQRHQGPQQQPESSHAGTSWTTTVSDSPSPQGRHPHGGASSGGGDGPGLYTPESAGSILASFGLSNEDLEVLSHYPDDQLTPDTLPFILRDIQINKTGKQKTVACTSSSSFSCSTHDMPQLPSHTSPSAHSRSPEVPSLLTVTQTAGKVIDYGHSSRAKDENSSRETFKREQLSNEKTVKMYPSSSGPKGDKAERRHIHLEHTEPSKHGDRDYRRASSDQQKTNREIPPPSKSRNLDRDYRHDGPKPRPSSEARSENSSRRSLSSSSGSKPHSSSSSSSKTLPTPTMISDFSAVSPKVYPHTCSLCHILCDQEKDWVDHINTVNHTAACRDLRNKYPEWKPNVPRRGGRYGRQAQWDPKDRSPSRSVTGSLSCSPTPSPPHNKHRLGPHPHRPHGKLYPPHPRYHNFPDHGHRLEHHHSGSQSPIHSQRTTREHRPGKRARDSPGVSSRGGVKRPEDNSAKCFRVTGRLPASRGAHNSKHGLSQPNTKTVKSGTKNGTKMPKTASAKAADTSVKPPLTKKKRKMVNPASQVSSVAGRLVYLTGIPNDASEQEVTDLVGFFGKINNVILMPCSERGSEIGEGQKASVCMVRAEDAQTLAKSTDLSIRDQHITASTAKKPERGQSSDASNSKPAPGQIKAAAAAAGEDSGSEVYQKTSDEKGTMLITGLPEGSWSESDIIKLIQPFGTPSDIILATQIGKVLLSVSDTEIAQEIMKVHSFVPAKIEDSELKIIQVKQRIGLSTPVALYNLLMGSLDPIESPVPVGWSSLLVISNVPNTPSGSSEVQKLVQRFGTVIKTLVLNNMVIFEMATAAMALSVYKRFQTFPCIIQNNPLFFSRKPDPKSSSQTKVIAAYLDSSEDLSANSKSSQMAAAPDEAQTAQKEKSECPMEDTEKDVVELEKEMKDTEETAGEDEALEDSGIKDEIQKNRPVAAVSDSSAPPDVKPETAMDTDMREISAVVSVVETEEEKELVNASEAGNDKTPAGEEKKLFSCDDKAASGKTVMKLVLPKVTQEMVNTLLVECRTRTASHPDNVANSACGLGGETSEEGGKAAPETKVPVKSGTEEETKKQEKERREREVRKEKEARERERKERERRVREREDRAKREREWDERGRREREEEKRERERRERKRTHGEGLSAPRSSCRSEGIKQSCHRDERFNNSEADNKMVVEEEEEEEFPFNMSDFVTVDEVGDVSDLAPSPSPVISMETTEGGEDAPTSVQQNDPQDTPMEVATETAMTDATVTLAEEQVSECGPASAAAAAGSSDSSASSAPTPGEVLAAAVSTSLLASQADSSPSQSPEAPDSEATLIAAPEFEHLPMPAPAASDNPPEPAPAENPSNSPATGPVPADSEGDKKEDSQAEEGAGVLDKLEEREKRHDQVDKNTGAPAAETAKHQSSEDQTHTQEECVEMRLQTKNTECSLPPFDPSSPVGMEFLVPKTGFFCKVCNRFFSGTKEAELSHCKTVKHYESLRKYLQSPKTVNVTTKP